MCKNPTPPLCFDPLRIVVSLVVLNVSIRERFLHSYKECFVHLSNRCAISQSTSLPLLGPTFSLAHRRMSDSLTIRLHWGQASLLAHRLVSSSDIICNGSSPPLTNIVCFGPLRIVVSLMILNVSTRERLPYPYKECFVPLSN